jgi:hypothetical protein
MKGTSTQRLPLPILLPKWKMTNRRVSGNLFRPIALTEMVHTALHVDLQLSKKSARWVTKLLYADMKKVKVRMWEAFTR